MREWISAIFTFTFSLSGVTLWAIASAGLPDRLTGVRLLMAGLGALLLGAGVLISYWPPTGIAVGSILSIVGLFITLTTLLPNLPIIHSPIRLYPLNLMLIGIFTTFTGGAILGNFLPHIRIPNAKYTTFAGASISLVSGVSILAICTWLLLRYYTAPFIKWDGLWIAVVGFLLITATVNLGGSIAPRGLLSSGLLLGTFALSRLLPKATLENFIHGLPELVKVGIRATVWGYPFAGVIAILFITSAILAGHDEIFSDLPRALNAVVDIRRIN